MPRANLQTRVRHVALRSASWFAPPGDAPLPDLSSLRRILIVYVNFRLGNTILATPGVDAVTRALPDAEIDIVGGPSAPAVYRGFPVGRIHVVRRHDYWNLFRVGTVVRSLRKGRYDAAIHMGTTNAGIGAFTCRVSRAPVRIGCKRPQGNVYFTSTVEAPPLDRHKVERLNEYVRRLGLPADGRRRMIMDPEEQEAASAFLASRSGDAPRIAVFLSGRARKRKDWNEGAMGAITEGLRTSGAHPVVIFGPEERRRAGALKALLGEATYVQDRSIREVAAIVQQCEACVVPDSGPMHLAVAVGTPTVALFRNEDFWKWGPQEGEGLAVHDPAGREVAGVLDALRNVRRPDARDRSTGGAG